MAWLDADQAQLRDPYDDAQAEVSAVVSALAGPAYALGDDLTALPPARLDLALDATILDLAASDAAAMPVDLLATPTAELVPSPLIEAIRLPNETDVPPPALFTATGASGTRYRITFRWLQQHGVDIAPE